MSEIEQVEDIIIAIIHDNVTGIKTCDAWPGQLVDIEEILAVPQKLPSLWVIYGGCKFGEKRVIGGNLVALNMSFALALVTNSLRSKKDGSRGAYELIEDIRLHVTGKLLSPVRGYLWPVDEQLPLVKSGSIIYGMEYKRQIDD